MLRYGPISISHDLNRATCASILTGFSQTHLILVAWGCREAIIASGLKMGLGEGETMRATLLTWRKYITYWYLRIRRVVRLHIDSSMKVSKEDADLFINRLKKASQSHSKRNPQIKDGQKKIVNLKSQLAAQKTLKDLPVMMAPQEHWFEHSIEGQGGRLRKSSDTYNRLQAFVSNLAPEINEIDCETPSEHI